MLDEGVSEPVSIYEFGIFLFAMICNITYPNMRKIKSITYCSNATISLRVVNKHKTVEFI